MTATSAPARPAPVLRGHVTPPVSFARVLGIEARRSPMPLILPLVPCANTNFPVFMAAEKIADAMLGER